ncbi:hypothetical protein B0H13DRAFT_972109 [Mycena leptocephala]|nr:hypothetical protein B0H13DRAFT_972109 [Mycena leptocephala]
MNYTIDPNTFASHWDSALARTYGIYIARLAIEGAVWPAPPALGPTNLYDRLYVAKDFLLVTNNIVTDGLFIYRCFVVWGCNICIVVLPMLMLFATTVLGYLVACEDDFISPYQLDPRVPIAITILTNIVLMGLTAGRIWWTRRDARIILESVHVHRYNTALPSFIPIFGVALTQIMNIAPTLMIVRVGLGRTDQDTPDPEEQRRRRAFGFPRARPTAARDTPTFGVRRVTSTVTDITAAHDIDLRADISMTKLGKL